MSRLTISRHSEQSMPYWSALQQLSAETPRKHTFEYIPPITPPPTRPFARSITLRRQRFFKKKQPQGRLKQLNLEQDLGHNTRQQENILQNPRSFYHKSLKTYCTFYSFQQL